MTDVGLQIAMTRSAAEAPGPSIASVRDYLALLKPRVMSLVVFTALVGLVLAPGPVHPLIGFVSLLAIAVGAGASGALNMWYDADLDRMMARTRSRPIPAGRVRPDEALTFGIFLSGASVLILGLVANWRAAGLLAFTIFFYAVIYTIWLKRRTAQNIVIGGAAGALPPVVAWTAATGTLSLESLVLFGIIFLWTPPHFWALALFRADDYRKAGVPMLPVTRGPDATRRQILFYTLVLVPFALLPWIMGFGHHAYALTATVGGAAMLRSAFEVWRERKSDRPAKRLFSTSIFYLFALFAALLAESLVGGIWT